MYESFYPPLCVQGPVSGRWYVIADGKWHEVGRQIHWSELEKMWVKKKTKPKTISKSEKITYKVKGSKGNTYKVVNDDGFWSCTCPAHGFGRGKDCKHIKQIKDEASKKRK